MMGTGDNVLNELGNSWMRGSIIVIFSLVAMLDCGPDDASPPAVHEATSWDASRATVGAAADAGDGDTARAWNKAPGDREASDVATGPRSEVETETSPGQDDRTDGSAAPAGTDRTHSTDAETSADANGSGSPGLPSSETTKADGGPPGAGGYDPSGAGPDAGAARTGGSEQGC